MTDPKHPSAALWITVALVAVLAYVASFGPACWLNQRTGMGGYAMVKIYGMFVYLAESCHCHRPLYWYARLGTNDATLYPWFVDNDKAVTVWWHAP